MSSLLAQFLSASSIAHSCLPLVDHGEEEGKRGALGVKRSEGDLEG